MSSRNPNILQIPPPSQYHWRWRSTPKGGKIASSTSTFVEGNNDQFFELHPVFPRPLLLVGDTKRYGPQLMNAFVASQMSSFVPFGEHTIHGLAAVSETFALHCKLHPTWVGWEIRAGIAPADPPVSLRVFPPPHTLLRIGDNFLLEFTMPFLNLSFLNDELPHLTEVGDWFLSNIDVRSVSNLPSKLKMIGNSFLCSARVSKAVDLTSLKDLTVLPPLSLHRAAIGSIVLPPGITTFGQNCFSFSQVIDPNFEFDLSTQLRQAQRLPVCFGKQCFRGATLRCASTKFPIMKFGKDKLDSGCLEEITYYGVLHLENIDPLLLQNRVQGPFAPRIQSGAKKPRGILLLSKSVHRNLNSLFTPFFFVFLSGIILACGVFWYRLRFVSVT